MGRAVWMAVGAVSGIYAYRKGTRAIDGARERGFVGNVQIAANGVATVAGGTSRLISLAAQAASKQDETAELPAALPVGSRPALVAVVDVREARSATAR